MKKFLFFTLAGLFLVAMLFFNVLAFFVINKSLIDANHSYIKQHLEFTREHLESARENSAFMSCPSPSNKDIFEDPLLCSLRQIFISQYIDGLLADRVIKQLLYLQHLDKDKPITLYISTNGGDFGASFAIIDIIRSISPKVNTVAVGECYSAGVYLLVAGTGVRQALSNSYLTVFIGNLDECSSGDIYDETKGDILAGKRLRELFMARSSIPREWFGGEARSYYISPAQAKEFRIIDEIAR